MRNQSSRFVTAASLLAAAPVSWAHPGLFDGTVIANLAHLLTEPEHLLIIAGAGLAAAILWHTKKPRA